jgi:hypothetical protein
MNIDEATLAMAKAFNSPLEKTLPPKLAYRLRQWFKKLSQTTNLKDPQIQKTVLDAIIEKAEELNFISDLKKNEVAASVYANGSIKMIFGEKVSPKTKAQAMAWAKKRGLDPVEATLNKSEDTKEEVVFGDLNLSKCLKRIRFSE